MPSQELPYFSVAVEDKYCLLFFKNDWYCCKMTVLGCDYLSQYVLEFHSFGLMLMLGSSHPEVKVALKILQNSQENTCAGASFLRKLQEAHKLSKFSGAIFLQDICERPSLSVLYFMISQKRKHFKSNNNCKSKGNMCASLNWNFI